MVVQVARVEFRLAQYAAVGHSLLGRTDDSEDSSSLLVAQRLEDDVLELVSTCFRQIWSSKTGRWVTKNGF